MTSADARRCSTEAGHCTTCADEGVEMRVVRAEGEELAHCRGPGGDASLVDVGLVGPVAAGDLLLVHAGTALVRLGEGAA